MPCRFHAVPLLCHDLAVLKATSIGHGAARHESGMGMAWYAWISIGRPETACGRPVRVRLLPVTTRSSTKVVTRSRLAVRIFSSTTRTSTKDTALSENGRVAAWRVWIHASGERHGVCELALSVFNETVLMVRLCYVGGRWVNGALVKWYWQGTTQVHGEKPISVLGCPSDILGIVGSCFVVTRSSHGFAYVSL
jgi:hypothetical protein